MWNVSECKSGKNEKKEKKTRKNTWTSISGGKCLFCVSGVTCTRENGWGEVRYRGRWIVFTCMYSWPQTTIFASFANEHLSFFLLAITQISEFLLSILHRPGSSTFSLLFHAHFLFLSHSRFPLLSFSFSLVLAVYYYYLLFFLWKNSPLYISEQYYFFLLLSSFFIVNTSTHTFSLFRSLNHSLKYLSILSSSRD